MPLYVQENAVADLEAILDTLPQPNEARIILSGNGFDYSLLLAQAGEVTGDLPIANTSTFQTDLKEPSRELLLAIYRRQKEVNPHLPLEFAPESQTHFPKKYISLGSIGWGETSLSGEEKLSSQNYLISWTPSFVVIAHGSTPPEFIPRLERELKTRNIPYRTDPSLF